MNRSLTGEHFQYLVICDTKLWYHHHRLIDTTGNSHVQIGNLVEKNAYNRDEEVRIGSSVLDFTRNDGETTVVHEVKKSTAFKKADKLQLLHYLSLVSNNNTHIDVEGRLRYPEENTVEKVGWNDETRKQYQEAVDKITKIVAGDQPEPTWKGVCRNCSMKEFCFS